MSNGKRYQGDHPGKRRPGERSWGGRFYEVEGRMLPSVTNILDVISKPALVGWGAKVERELCLSAASDLWDEAPLGDVKMTKMVFRSTLQDRIGKVKAYQREQEKAAEIGTQVHKLIEFNLKLELGEDAGVQPTVNAAALWAFQAYERWRAEVHMKPVAAERFIYNLEYEYAGTIDLLYADTDYGPSVIDFKTGKAIYSEAKLQVAAYGIALGHMKHLDAIPHGLILRLPKIESDPEFEVCHLTPEEMQTHFTAFLHAKQVWAWQNKERFPNGMEMTPETADPAG